MADKRSLHVLFFKTLTSMREKDNHTNIKNGQGRDIKR
jgi:hypothetical protein